MSPLYTCLIWSDHKRNKECLNVCASISTSSPAVLVAMASNYGCHGYKLVGYHDCETATHLKKKQYAL